MRSQAPGWGWWGGGELPLLPSGCTHPVVQQDLLPLGTAGVPQDNGYVTPMCHPMPPTHHHGISMATVPTVALAEPCHPQLLMPLLPSASSGLHRKHFLPHSCAEKRRQEIHIQYPHIHYLPDKTYCLHN